MVLPLEGWWSLGAKRKQGIHAHRVWVSACLRQAGPVAPVSGGEAGQMNFLAQSAHKRAMPIGVSTKQVAPFSDFGKDISQRTQVNVSCESSISLAPL
jgi:hypothetical protein